MEVEVCPVSGQQLDFKKRLFELEEECFQLHNKLMFAERETVMLRVELADLKRAWPIRLVEAFRQAVSNNYKRVTNKGYYFQKVWVKKSSKHRCEDCGILKLNARRRQILESHHFITQCDECAEKASLIYGFQYK